jgi:hypothetical protein
VSPKPVAVGIDRSDRRAGDDLYTEALELSARLLRQRLREARQHARAGLDQAHARGRWVDVAELALERVPRNLGERAGQLDAGRAATDDREMQPRVASRGIALGLCVLEREQQAPAQQQCVVERLQARCVRGPLVVSEVGVSCAGREQQRVVVDRVAVAEHDSPRRRFDANDVGQADFHVRLGTQDVPQRRGDVRRRQSRRRDLVQQRLEQMMVRTIDERDPHRRACERTCRPQAAETAADDHCVMGVAGHRCSSW